MSAIVETIAQLAWQAGAVKILIVCTGNICRSPMAHALLEHRLNEASIDDVRVSSAGTWAGYSAPATAEAVDVLRGEGIDLSAHGSTPLTEELLEEADVIVVMTSVHLNEIAKLSPESAKKTFLLKELTELQMEGSGVSGLLAARRPAARRDLDLDDPMGLPFGAYERAYREISAGIDALMRVLSSR